SSHQENEPDQELVLLCILMLEFALPGKRERDHCYCIKDITEVLDIVSLDHSIMVVLSSASVDAHRSVTSKPDGAMPTLHFPLTKTTLLKRRKFFYAIGNTRATNIFIRHRNLQSCPIFETGSWQTGNDVTRESEIAAMGVSAR
ncbi:unnamed protein product, partial [Amoebophrya sp. A25]